jgi:hypothetical protein
MANDVFANGREISCKAADGKSIACFPDVCMTPPENPATPPGVPIPYPNTAFAKDTSAGSKTVKISGKETMLKNKSYFKTSTGDEAGCAAKKGVVTSKIKGKAYFVSWSMDVKFEGENVVRHLDMTTHNHASPTPNTMTWPYCDSQALSPGGPCKEENEYVEEFCSEAEKKVQADIDAGKIPKQSQNKARREAYCDDPDCKEARKCMLVPYKPELKEGQVGCCSPLTGHHVIPAHCFMPPGVRAAGGSERYPECEAYDPDAAPCICVEGAGKEKEHGDIHEICDMLEDSHMENGSAGSWSVSDSATACAMSVNEVTNCDEDCIKAQVDQYHKENCGMKDGTPLRANSAGTRTPEGFTPSKTEVGDIG